MRLIFLIVLILTFNLCFAQDYKKDNRSKIQKENAAGSYQVDNINQVNLLTALELTGINIFKIPLSFDKEYHFSMMLDEYVDGKKVRTKNISPRDNNIYYHFIKNDSAKTIRYYDFIDEIVFYAKEMDSVCSLKIETYGSGISGIKLGKKKDRLSQNYNWRRYSKTEWQLDKSIPLLIYASSWYDKDIDADRFCGIGDLSEDETILLKNSPHYYIISYKISE